MRFATAACALLLTATAAQAQGPAAPGSDRLGLELRSCRLPDVEDAVRCGVFRVPEDRSKPGGRVLPLKVIVLPARSATPAKAPVVFLSGGPGQGATDAVVWMAKSWHRDEHDVVLMDLRGTGEGHALDCPPGDGDDLQSALEPLFADTAAVRACRQRLEQRADLTLYTTPVAMRDLDELRRALGYEQLNLWGGSYGTRAALVYVRSYGRSVRTVFATGAAPFENRAPLHHAAGAQAAFDRLADQCAADAGCRAAYPDVRGDLAAVLRTVETRPPGAAVRHPATGEPAQVTLTRSAFADGLRSMLYSAEEGRRVPLLLQRARAGDYAPFAQAALAAGYGLRRALRLGLTLSVTCPEDVTRIRSGEVPAATAGSFVGDHRVRGQMAGCAEWRKARMPEGYAAPFRSAVPAVVVSGDLDPVTPPAWGEAYRRYFRHSVHLVLPAGHSAQNDCADAVHRQLLRTADVRSLDTGCVERLRHPRFVLPGEDRPAPGASA